MPITIDLLNIERNHEDQELLAAVLEKLNQNPIGFFIPTTQVHKLLIIDKVSGKKQTYEIQLSHPLTRHRKTNSFLDNQKEKQKQVHRNYIRYDLDLDKHLGEGAFSYVKKLSKYFYLLDGKLIVKSKKHAGKFQIPDEENPIEDIIRESRLTMAAQHLRAKKPIINTNNDQTLIVMRYIKGITLLELLKEYQTYPLTTEQRYRLTLNCLFAMLEQTVNYDLIHGDIKPENIMVNPTTLEVTIFDYGLGDSNSKPEIKETRGTYDYMAPELLDGSENTQKSDLFAIGMVIANIWCDGHIFSSGYITNFANFKIEMLKRAVEHKTLFTVPRIADLTTRDVAYIKNGILALTNPNPNKRFDLKDVIENFITVYADHQFYAKKLTLAQGVAMKKGIDIAFHIRLNMQNLLLAKNNNGHVKLIALLESQLPDQEDILNEFFKILGSNVLERCQNKAAIIRKVNDEFELTQDHIKQLNATIIRMSQERKFFQHFDRLHDVAEYIFEMNLLLGEATELRTKLENAYHFDRRAELNAKYQEKIDKLNDRLTQLSSHCSQTVAFFLTHRKTISSLQQPLESDAPRDQLIFMIKQEILKYMQSCLNKETIIKSSRAASPERLKTIEAIIAILDNELKYDPELLISTINRHLGKMTRGIRGSDLADHVHAAIQQFENRPVHRRLSMS